MKDKEHYYKQDIYEYNSKIIQLLIHKFGVEGYGLYIIIVSMLYGISGINPKINLEIGEMNSIISSSKLDKELVQDIIKWLANSDNYYDGNPLLYIDENNDFGIFSIDKAKTEWEETAKKNTENGKKGGQKKAENRINMEKQNLAPLQGKTIISTDRYEKDNKFVATPKKNVANATKTVGKSYHNIDKNINKNINKIEGGGGSIDNSNNMQVEKLPPPPPIFEEVEKYFIEGGKEWDYENWDIVATKFFDKHIENQTDEYIQDWKKKARKYWQKWREVKADDGIIIKRKDPNAEKTLQEKKAKANTQILADEQKDKDIEKFEVAQGKALVHCLQKLTAEEIDSAVSNLNPKPASFVFDLYLKKSKTPEELKNDYCVKLAFIKKLPLHYQNIENYEKYNKDKVKSINNGKNSASSGVKLNETINNAS